MTTSAQRAAAVKIDFLASSVAHDNSHGDICPSHNFHIFFGPTFLGPKSLYTENFFATKISLKLKFFKFNIFSEGNLAL